MWETIVERSVDKKWYTQVLQQRNSVTGSQRQEERRNGECEYMNTHTRSREIQHIKLYRQPRRDLHCHNTKSICTQHNDFNKLFCRNRGSLVGWDDLYLGHRSRQSLPTPNIRYTCLNIRVPTKISCVTTNLHREGPTIQKPTTIKSFQQWRFSRKKSVLDDGYNKKKEKKDGREWCERSKAKKTVFRQWQPTRFENFACRSGRRNGWVLLGRESKKSSRVTRESIESSPDVAVSSHASPSFISVRSMSSTVIKTSSFQNSSSMLLRSLRRNVIKTSLFLALNYHHVVC